ncbi:hypothetical protein [Rhizobium sp. BK251]|nr:hypothetical protein [Rhizobium sp. BK251]
MFFLVWVRKAWEVVRTSADARTKDQKWEWHALTPRGFTLLALAMD